MEADSVTTWISLCVSDAALCGNPAIERELSGARLAALAEAQPWVTVSHGRGTTGMT